jgi:hypothetical protein
MSGLGYVLPFECLTLSVGRTDNIHTTFIPSNKRNVIVLHDPTVTPLLCYSLTPLLFHGKICFFNVLNSCSTL